MVDFLSPCVTTLCSNGKTATYYQSQTHSVPERTDERGRLHFSKSHGTRDIDGGERPVDGVDSSDGQLQHDREEGAGCVSGDTRRFWMINEVSGHRGAVTMTRTTETELRSRVRTAATRLIVVAAALAATLRQPEYTGENRCLPCTVVNAMITAVGSVGVGVVASPIAGTVALTVGAAAIWLRGYLVPYTPQLTERYLPERVLAWFGKAESPTGLTGVNAAANGAAANGGTAGDSSSDVTGDATDGEQSVEGRLLAAGVLRPAGDDYELAPSFRASWRERAANQSPTDTAAFHRLVTGERDTEDRADDDNGGSDADLNPQSVTFDRRDGRFRALIDGRTAAAWESPVAAAADFAAVPALARQVPDWGTSSVPARVELLAALRLWLPACPDCGGMVSLSRDTVSSCCQSVPVAAGTCDDCGVRLFEVPVDETAMDAE